MLLYKEKELVESYLPEVKKILCRYIRPNEAILDMAFDDLYQVGCEALCHAAKLYNPNRNASFKTFAEIVIRNKLLEHCRKANRLQAPLCYLDANTNVDDSCRYVDFISDNLKGTSAQEREIYRLLDEIRQDYTGIAQKGIIALKYRCMGYSRNEIASCYGVKPNHVSAWMSRAGSKLRKDRRMLSLLAK